MSLGNPRSWSLRLKVAALVVALTTVGALASALVFFGTLRAEVRTFDQDRIEREAALIATDWRLRWEAIAADAAFLAETPPIEGLARSIGNGGVDPRDGSSTEIWVQRLESIFTPKMRTRPIFLQIRLIELGGEGAELVRVERSADGVGIELIRGDALQAKGGEPYVIQARGEAARYSEGEDPAFFSAITLNREFGQIVDPPQPVSRAMALARDENGEPWAVVVINVELEPIFAGQVEGELLTGRRYTVTNAAGQVLFDSRDGVGFAFEFADDPGVGGRSDALDALLGLDGIGAPETEDDGGQVEAVRMVELPGTEDVFALLLSGTSQEAANLAGDTLRRAALWILVVLGLTMALGIRLGARATAPFVALSRAIEVSKAIPARTVPVPDEPEAAHLARAINRATQASRNALARLKRTNEELDAFAGVASHDLQEPARTVNSFATLLEQEYGDQLDDDGRRMLGYLSDAGKRMQRQIRELLVHARIGRTRNEDTVDLDSVLDWVLADLDTAIVEAGARFERTPLPSVAGSATDLRLLLQNLVSNALKFRRSDIAPVVRISTLPGADAHVVVADNGIGVAEELREEVFGMFRRGKTVQEYAGTGIGLAHCRKIVETHGGEIWIGPSDVGTEVHFTISSESDTSQSPFEVP